MNGTTENVTHQNDDDIPETPLWLKLLVWGLGAAIITMLGLILYKIVTGVGDMVEDGVPPVELAAVPPAAGTKVIPAGNFDVARPADMELVSVVPANGEVFLHFRGVDGADQIIILNRLTGGVSNVNIAKPED